jgi:hypothetical protein
MEERASISYKQLRQTIGWLGISLPVILFLYTQFFGHCNGLQDSISHYYYTSANVLFVGIFWGLGLVLFFYPSYTNEPNNDAIITSLAGACALCVSLFPTNPNSSDSCAIFELSNSPIRAGVHYVSAALMLGIFSYMSICIFTKTTIGNDLKSEANKWKRIRNKIYVIAGCLTILSVILIGVFTLLEANVQNFNISTKYTYWLEVTALLPFGIAWIIKGGFAFTDEDEISTIGKAKKLFVKQKRLNKN